MSLIGILFFACNIASAQEPRTGTDPEFMRLQRILHANDKISVTLENGTEVLGRLTEVSPDRLVLHFDAEPTVRRSFDVAQITRVQQHKNGVLLGALIGAGAGGFFAYAIQDALRNNVGRGDQQAAAGVFIGGTALGIGIDALLSRPHTVYKRRPGTRITAQPILDRNHAGLGVALNF